MEEIRLAAGGGGFAASYYKTLQPLCRAIEIHPLLVLRTTSHGGGSFSGTMPCDAYEIYQIMAVSPFGGWRQYHRFLFHTKKAAPLISRRALPFSTITILPYLSS